MEMKSEALRRLALAGVVTGFLAFGAACNDDNDVVDPPPPPPAEGAVTAVVADDPAVPPDPENGEPTYTGTLSAQANVEISADGAEWVELGTPQAIQVELQTGERAAVHEQINVEVGEYTQIRLHLTDVQVQLDAGGTVGETTLEEDVTLLVGNGEQITFESAVSLIVAQATQSTVVFDLNSSAWITEEAVQAEQVAAGDMEGAVDVEVDGDGTENGG